MNRRARPAVDRPAAWCLLKAGRRLDVDGRSRPIVQDFEPAAEGNCNERNRGFSAMVPPTIKSRPDRSLISSDPTLVASHKAHRNRSKWRGGVTSAKIVAATSNGKSGPGKRSDHIGTQNAPTDECSRTLGEPEQRWAQPVYVAAVVV